VARIDCFIVYSKLIYISIYTMYKFWVLIINTNGLNSVLTFTQVSQAHYFQHGRMVVSILPKCI
jgi:hypothetical protein